MFVSLTQYSSGTLDMERRSVVTGSSKMGALPSMLFTIFTSPTSKVATFILLVTVATLEPGWWNALACWTEMGLGVAMRLSDNKSTSRFSQAAFRMNMPMIGFTPAVRVSNEAKIVGPR